MNCAIALAAALTTMAPAGEWSVKVECGGSSAVLKVDPPERVEVKGERHACLPAPVKRNGWTKECKFMAVRAMECTVGYAVVQDSIRISTADGRLLVRDRDYTVDPQWGGIEWKEGATMGTNVPITVDYAYLMRRLDSVVAAADGSLRLRKGASHIVTPSLPELSPRERRVGNILLDAETSRLADRNLFPVLEEAPRPPSSCVPVAAELLPKTWAKLNAGGKVRILAWGDSVTAGGFVPNSDKWQEQFVRRLRARFPKADIELVVNAWPGRSSQSFLLVPPDDRHHFTNFVAGAKADLVVSEFVNDAGAGDRLVKKHYPTFLKAFREAGTEWIIMTPHYVRPDWMGLKGCKNTDDDPRPFVKALRVFAADNRIALADAAKRWGHLWREGMPFSVMYANDINHPLTPGMTIFADALMDLFGRQ